MPQQKTRRSRSAKDPVSPKAEEEEQLDAVILIVKRTPDGAEIIPVTQGDVRPTEVQSIIALGYRSWVTSRKLTMGENL